jgi:hypothetical protein
MKVVETQRWRKPLCYGIEGPTRSGKALYALFDMCMRSILCKPGVSATQNGETPAMKDREDKFSKAGVNVHV